MKKRRVWYRDFDRWWYGQVGKGRHRRQKRILEGKNDARTRREAQRRYDRLLQSDPGLLEELSSTSRLKPIFISFLKKHSKKHCSPETHRWYRHFLKSFARKYGTVRFCDLTPDDIEGWLDSNKRWGETTRNRAITCVKVAVNWFIRRKRTRDNPLQDLRKPPMARREKIISRDERRLIMRSIKDRPFKLFLFAVSSTGARPGEVRRVTRANLHPSGLWIFPPRRHKTGKKTGRPRVIYLTPPMVKLCSRLAEEHPEGPLFRNTRGHPWTQNAVRIRFRNLRKRLPALKGIVCYCWRHTWTTDALERGIPVATVSELLGHSNTRMVSEFYGHLSDRADYLREAAAKATRRPAPSQPEGEPYSHR
jgi:integrase